MTWPLRGVIYCYFLPGLRVQGALRVALGWKRTETDKKKSGIFFETIGVIFSQ